MSSLVQSVYNRTLRPWLLRTAGGRKYRMLAGVPVRNAALFDRTEHLPDYKRGLATLVQEAVRPGDHVIEIGGGRGVMTVLAARNGAEVTSFEPSADMIGMLRDTLRASDITEGVTIERAIVGELGADYGSVGGASVIPPDDLPECDVLVMDCEGAEVGVCEHLAIRPDRIIVETHPDGGRYYGPDDLVELLNTSRDGENRYELADVRALKPDSSRHAVLIKRCASP